MKKTKHIIPPCRKCPYKLGYVKTPFNPCPRCNPDGYRTYDHFLKSMMLDKVNGRKI